MLTDEDPNFTLESVNITRGVMGFLAGEARERLSLMTMVVRARALSIQQILFLCFTLIVMLQTNMARKIVDI